MNRKAILFGAIICCFCGVSVSAQRRAVREATPPAQPAQTAPQTSAPKDVSTESADIAITATVTARELRFEVVPNPTVEFPGKHQRETVWDAERDNLPRSIEPGVTYRDIGIRLKIVSRFADIERIVAEALGEVPLTDEVQPQEKTPSQPNNNTTPPASPQSQTSRPSGGSPQ